ncbi:uncharacterized protein ACRADG_012913 isoform 3-T3 [Cochliomyia hominivorax]
MAVFLLNICKFNGCGITFPSLGDLIQHIEDTHIDYDPKVVEQKEQAQPACLPLSYVLRFISDDARKESPFLTTNATGAELKRKLAIKHHSYSMSSSNRSNTPTGSEMDEDEMVVSESEDSNDSWTTEEFSSEFIMRYGSRHSGSGSNGTPGNEKPFACPVPGCKKRYKNVNGIKYHSKNGHKKDGKVRKGYKCHCGKSYKTAQGLKSHALVAHNSSPENVLATQNLGSVLTTSGGGILMHRSSSPSQSLGSLSPSSISNMSSGASSCHGSGGHFSNSSSSNNGAVGSTACLAQAINGTTLNLQPQQQQQQQQFTTTANNHQQQVVTAGGVSSGGVAVSSGLTGSIAAVAGTVTHNTTATESSSSPFSGQLLATAIQQRNLSTSTNGGSAGSFGVSSGGGNVINNNANCFYAATAPVTPTANLPQNAHATAATTQLPSLPPAAISPTFIEHKYSANTFKEKFFANLRQQNLNKTKTLKTTTTSSNNNSITKTDCDGKNEINTLKRNLDIVNTNEVGFGCGNNNHNNKDDVEGSGGSYSNDGLENEVGINLNTNDYHHHQQTDICSTIQQQLTENVKNNLYKKTIN